MQRLHRFFVAFADYIVGAGRWGGTNLRKFLIIFCFYLGMPALLLRTITSTPVGDTPSYVIWVAYLNPVFICCLVAISLTLSKGEEHL